MTRIALAAMLFQDWTITPRIQSAVRPIRFTEVAGLLSGVCRTTPRYAELSTFRCETKVHGAAFTDMLDSFNAHGVIYGHFLSPMSEDAIISGFSAEHHPDRGGGSLLLTKRNGQWIPVQYKSGVITRSCQKTPLSTKQEILVCEDEYAGMGFHSHFVYTVDPGAPGDLREHKLVSTLSVNSSCAKRSQRISSVRFSPVSRQLTVTILTTRWYRSGVPCAVDPGPEKRPPREQVFRFRLQGSELVRISPGT